MTLVALILIALAFCTVGMIQTAPTKRAVEKRRVRDLKTRPQVRKTFPDETTLRQLARSCIKRLIHPLIILADGTILDGECRFRGLMLENPDFEADVIVVDYEPTPGEIVEMQMVSAMHSTSLRAFDQAVACRDWFSKNPGATAKELATKIDRDQSVLTRLVSLFKCIPTVIKAAEEGKCGPSDWYEFSQATEDQQGQLLALKLAGASRDEIAARRRKVSNGKPPATEVASRIRCVVPGRNATVQVVCESSATLEEMIEITQEWVKRAKKASENGWDAKTLERACRDENKKP